MRTVLAQLVLSLDPDDRNLERDDAFYHLRFEFFRQSVPLRAIDRVVLFYEVFQDRNRVDDASRSIGVHSRVIPGRDAKLALIERRGNIRMWPGEDHQRLAFAKRSPV